MKPTAFFTIALVAACQHAYCSDDRLPIVSLPDVAVSGRTTPSAEISDALITELSQELSGSSVHGFRGVAWDASSNSSGVKSDPTSEEMNSIAQSTGSRYVIFVKSLTTREISPKAPYSKREFAMPILAEGHAKIAVFDSSAGKVIWETEKVETVGYATHPHDRQVAQDRALKLAIKAYVAEHAAS